MIGSPEHPDLTFGIPPDAVAWAALLCAVLCALLKYRPPRPAVELALLCTLSFGLSFGYFYFYLGGAPRIIDATAYLLEARSFADGSFSFEVPAPSASFRGRFLIHTAQDPQRLAAIFPPGYPALLALGVLLGAPFVIGPMLAVALVALTHRLALEVTGRLSDARLAACLSALCACLRYHTSETMSHGFAAVLTTSALLSAVQLLRTPRLRWGLTLGLSLGLLIATRQFTGALIAAATLGSLVWFRPQGVMKPLCGIAFGLIPGLCLLLAHHHAITGEFLVSPQSRYYDFADGPPGCFGLGLGRGCQYEHGDVVIEQGGEGLTLKWAMLNTLYRLKYHFLDIAHFEPLVLAGLFALWTKRNEHSILPLGLSLIFLPLGYSLFYFAGSYPAGGARFFSEIIPVWHVLIAWGLTNLRLARAGLCATLFGFAVHAAFSHGALKASRFGPDGSALSKLPSMIEQATTHPDADNAGRPKVVFFSTAHEFNLAWNSSESYVAARRTGDARQLLVQRQLGGAVAFDYVTKGDGPDLLSLRTSTDEGLPGQLSLESEFDYPPLARHDVWVHPEHVPQACISQGRALKIHRVGPHPRLVLETEGVPPGEYDVSVFGLSDRKCVQLDLGRHALPRPLALNSDTLRNLSHIDRILLTLPHL